MAKKEEKMNNLEPSPFSGEGKAKLKAEATVETPKKKDWLSMLQKDADKLVIGSRDPWTAHFPSPGLNYLFGKEQGMRAGYSLLLYGPPKSGKSLLAFAAAGQLHKEDPEAIVLHFDTEYRDNVDTWVEVFGIDKKRWRSFQTNNPVDIFDYIATTVKAMLQEGAPIKMIIIDSLAMINYPKEANKKQSTNFVIGDAGAYLSGAMKMIIPVMRSFKVAMIFCQHVRQNMDPDTKDWREWIIPGGMALKHSIEYWMIAQKIESKKTKQFDSDRKDGSGNLIQTGHAIRVKMEENSLGPQNRAVEIDLSYTRGLINQTTEIAQLAVNMGIVEINGSWVTFNGQKWQGVENFGLFLEGDEELQRTLMRRIKENDLT